MSASQSPAGGTPNKADRPRNAWLRPRRLLKPIDLAAEPGSLFRLPLLLDMSRQTAEATDVEDGGDNRLR